MPEKASPRKSLSYRDAGVDIDAGNELVDRIKPAVQTTWRDGVLSGLGGFGGLFRLGADAYRDPVLVAGTDGVGTKLMLARDLGVHDTIGIDLVAMCVNDILACGAEPLFFLDYFATGKLEAAQAQRVIEGIAEGCRQAGCALIGGETAEMPGMYGANEYDLAGFAVGVVERDRIIDGERIQAGDRLLGLPSSGPHSNGYSLIRAVLARSGTDPGARLAGSSLGEQLLAPTIIYFKLLSLIIDNYPINGIAHITGGGLRENIIRLLDPTLGIEVNTSAWPRPPIFEWLQDEGAITDAEMLRTFNCGIGMVLIVREDDAQAIIEAAAGAGSDCYDIGRVIHAPNDGQRVIWQ